jgi:dTDP-4-dehydrorhamnose reductase
MLGHKIFQRLQRDYAETYCTLHKPITASPYNRIPFFQGERVLGGIDVLHTGPFHALLRRLRPDVIVNCIGVIKQRAEGNAAIPNIRLNALLPHELAALCAEWHGRLIHFSTDCVFSGRTGNYREDSRSDAGDLYGRSKFLGEVAAPNAITLRTSFVGRELTEHVSLLDWFLSQRGTTVRGFRRVIYSGITTNEMANVVKTIIRDLPVLSGLFQVVSERITKYELLALVREAYGLDINLEPDDLEVSDRSMNGEKFREATGWRAPSWPDLVRELAADPTPYGEWGASVL